MHPGRLIPKRDKLGISAHQQPRNQVTLQTALWNSSTHKCQWNRHVRWSIHNRVLENASRAVNLMCFNVSVGNLTSEIQEELNSYAMNSNHMAGPSISQPDSWSSNIFRVLMRESRSKLSRCLPSSTAANSSICASLIEGKTTCITKSAFLWWNREYYKSHTSMGLSRSWLKIACKTISAELFLSSKSRCPFETAKE